MTNSEKQTKAPRAASADASSAAVPAYATADFWSAALSKRPTLVFGAVLLLIGWGFSLHINNWHFTVPVVVLWLAWLGAIMTVKLLWGVGLAVASESSGETMQELDVSEARRIELLEEKKSLIRAIKEIEFDRDLGKMSAEDATEMMRFYRARAIEVIKELDGNSNENLSVKERIERDLQARLAVENATKKAKVSDKAALKSDDEASSAETAKKSDDDETEGETAPSESEISEESTKKLAQGASEEQSEAPVESA